MPDYGVPTDPDGVLPWAWAEERLLRSRNYWIVTTSAAGRPHALPVWGVWRPGPADFAFSCAASSRKARNMTANPQVCVMADDTVECVSVEGTAELVVATAERDAIIAAYADKYVDAPAGPDARRGLAEFVARHEVWRVVPERAFGIIEREDEFSARATKWLW